jgi:hypothetical protein
LPADPSISKIDVVAVVADQFEEIRKQLGAQLLRTAKVQPELDPTRREVA